MWKIASLALLYLFSLYFNRSSVKDLFCEKSKSKFFRIAHYIVKLPDVAIDTIP